MYIIRSLLLFVVLCSNIIAQTDFIRGADISFLKQIEDNNGIFKENGLAKDALQIFKDHGVNYARLRLWKNPVGSYSGLESTIQLAKRVKQKGMKLLLDFHYSDTWADPSHQTKPADWNGITYGALQDSIHNYTKNVLNIMRQEGVLPDMVQTGNEITGGMLWNDGKVGGAYDTPAQWEQFSGLLKKSIQAVREMNDAGASIRTVIHIDRGGDSSASKWFFDHLISLNVPFDIIGLSYYPWWHGSLANFSNNLAMLALRYGKEIIVAETAYPWTLQWNDNTGNIVGQTSQLLAGYPASPEGQLNFLRSVKSVLRNVPSQKGHGFFVWAPDWISTAAFGSSWENLALFDFAGEALPALNAFDAESPVNETVPAEKEFILGQNYPNPFNPVSTIRYGLAELSHVHLKIFDALGGEIASLVDESQPAGSYEVKFNAAGLSSSIYFYRLTASGTSGAIRFTEVKKMIMAK